MFSSRLFFIFCLAFVILSVRFFYFYTNQPKFNDGDHIRFETALLTQPRIVNGKQRITANLSTGNRIYIRTNPYPQYNYSDTLMVEGSLDVVTFDNGDSIIMMSYPDIQIVEKEKGIFLKIASFIRAKSVSLFDSTLPPDSSGLLSGIVFGVKDSLSSDFSESLRVSGAFHVVAASGMNVTMVAGFLSSIFGFFLRRQVALFLSMFGIVIYAVLAGLDPPIVRASIMGILVFSALIMGRQSMSIYGLFLACFLMLFWSPGLIFDIGFQLSFSATLGILFIQPIIERGKKIKTILQRSIIGEEVSITIAAQLATLPIILSNFGSYSVWSVAANGLVLWTIPAIMIIGGLGAVIGMIIPGLGSFILYLSLPFLLYFENIIMIFGDLGGILTVENFSPSFTLGYYFLLIGIVIFLAEGGTD